MSANDNPEVVPLDPQSARVYVAGHRSGYGQNAGAASDSNSRAALERRSARARAQWIASQDYKKVKRESLGWFGLAAILGSLGAAGSLALWGFNLSSRLAVAAGVAGAVLTVLFAGVALYWKRMPVGYGTGEDGRDETGVPSHWLKDPDLQSLITLNRAQIQVYHDLATDRARLASRNSRVAMLVGFLLLVAGGVVAIQAEDSASKVVVGTLAGLGSLLSGYIGRNFRDAEDNAMKQLGFYFQQPLVTSYLLGAERLSMKLTGEKRAALLAEIVAEVLSVARAAEAASRGEVAPDSRARPRRGLPGSDQPATGPTGAVPEAA